jgi:hypothetical protein
VVFPHDQMQILPYNRLARDRAGRSPAALLEELRKVMDVEPAAQPAPESPLSFGVFAGGRWWRARVRPGSFDASDPVAALDCSIAQDQILRPIFGIEDPRRDDAVDFVGGIRGAASERSARRHLAVSHTAPRAVSHTCPSADPLGSDLWCAHREGAERRRTCQSIDRHSAPSPLASSRRRVG